jgi:hypothetical protein
MKTFKEHLDIELDKVLIAEKGKDICNISIDKLRSPTMKKLHRQKCGKKEKESPMHRAAKKAGMKRSNRDKLYNSNELGK